MDECLINASRVKPAGVNFDMLSYTTLDELRGWAPNITESSLTKAAQLDYRKNTFLSHSSKDKDLLPGAIYILEQHGARVYVDIGDDRLPDPPSTTTAAVLRSAIAETRHFVLLISPNSKASSWIPWELGLADGEKSLKSVALFPAVQYAAETKWTEQEYLGLYSRIIWGNLNGYTDAMWLVYDHHTNTAIRLADWLNT